MTQTLESALQTTYRLIMAQNRREQSDVVARMNRKRLTVNESDVRELAERKTKGGFIKGLNLVLPNYLFMTTKKDQSPMYQLENLVVDAEFCLISKDQTCVRYYRIQSVRQRELSEAWYIKLI